MSYPSDAAASPAVDVPAMSDAHHVLSEYHAFEAIASLCGDTAAEGETGASLRVHAVRMAAVLGELLAENAILRVIAVEAPDA